MDRFGRLEVARRADWRFLLPSPRLGRVALLGSVDEASAAAIAGAAIEVRHDPAVDDGGQASWDIVVVEASAGRDPVNLGHAVGLLRAGGSLLVHLPSRARMNGALSASMKALGRLDVERVQKLWYVPDRRSARRIVPLDDRHAVQVMLMRHGHRAARRVTVGAARQLVRAGLPADLLGGDMGLLARRSGGDPVRGWPSLEPLAAMLDEELGLATPSWILLTPRFPASAHVVALLLGAGEVRYVAKIARLAGDDGPRHEARMLERLAAAGIPAGAAPRLVASVELDGHALVLEEAISGQPLDRSVVRSDPRRSIRAASEWLAALPGRNLAGPADLDALVWEPLDHVRNTIAAADGSTGLVTRTVHALATLDRQALPAVLEHGDLSHPNILSRSDGSIAVLDWEMARPDGLPLNDLCFFLGYVALAMEPEGADPFDGFVRMLAEPTWGGVEAMRAEAERLGIDRAVMPALIIACWARAYATHLRSAGETATADGSGPANRYYRLWEGAVDRQDELRIRLA